MNEKMTEMQSEIDRYRNDRLYQRSPHVTEGGSDPTEFLSDSDPDFVGIRRNMIEIRPDPTRISSGSVEFRRNPGRNLSYSEINVFISLSFLLFTFRFCCTFYVLESTYIVSFFPSCV
jgi:hypothetical protein